MITSNIKILDLGKINSSPELLLQFKKQADEEISDNQTKKDGFEFLFSDNDDDNDDSDEESTDLELYSDDGEEDLIDVVSEKKQNFSRSMAMVTSLLKRKKITLNSKTVHQQIKHNKIFFFIQNGLGFFILIRKQQRKLKTMRYKRIQSFPFMLKRLLIAKKVIFL